jgi:hypothetical protein
MFWRIGWAYDLKTPFSEMICRMEENRGDGGHYKWGTAGVIGQGDGDSFELWGAAREMPEEPLIQRE